MKMMQLIAIGAAAVLSFTLVLLAPGTSAADRLVNSGEILLLSDEILGNSVEIERAGGGAPPTNGVPGAALPAGPAPVPILADGGGEDGGDSDSDSGDSDSDSGDSDGDSRDGNSHNRSGLGVGSNPGLGSGRSNSPNQGTGNPNQAPMRSHPSHR